MEIVLWLCGIAALLIALAYATIGALLLVTKYRMTHLPARAPDAPRGVPIVDLRYRTP